MSSQTAKLPTLSTTTLSWTAVYGVMIIALVSACGGTITPPSDADNGQDADAGTRGDAEADADRSLDAEADSDRDGDDDSAADADAVGDADSDAPLTSCTCQPGSSRGCSTDEGLGTQSCTNSGDGWDTCEEATTPLVCQGLAAGSLELFLCVLHENRCLEDWADADGDGDRVESLGRCQGVICPPLDCFCVPGAWRICDVPAYTFGGLCYCRNDGSAWGNGREQFSLLGDPCMSPSGWCYAECHSCLIDDGAFCVQDYWDSDEDGDTWESVGSCEGVVCS